MNKLAKYLNIATIGMFIITGVLMVLFYAGGLVPDQVHPTPVHTDEMIVWAYILFGVATAAAVIFGIFNFLTNIKEAKKTIIGLVVVGIFIAIGYSMSDGTPLEMPGYTGTGNVESTLKFADTILYLTYFLGIGAILSIITTEIIKKFR
ncbi:MAG: hypothetical protein N4A32_06405 [Marinifilaceae bacterium]|jgi:cation transport ATPase|nr:hypothetical protein [Marinifilaceae bacterium]